MQYDSGRPLNRVLNNIIIVIKYFNTYYAILIPLKRPTNHIVISIERPWFI